MENRGNRSPLWEFLRSLAVTGLRLGLFAPGCTQAAPRSAPNGERPGHPDAPSMGLSAACFPSKSKVFPICSALLLGLRLASVPEVRATPGVDSPTLLQIQELQRRERLQRQVEASQWWSFPRTQADDPSKWLIRAAAVEDPRCEFFWPGWKRQADGTWITRVRACNKAQVAVNCRTLEIAWARQTEYQRRDSMGLPLPPLVQWESWRHPKSSYVNSQEPLMVAAICDQVKGGDENGSSRL